MKLLLMLALLAATHANSASLERVLHEGDIIFHESRSSQSKAIQLATKSSYSHMGILYRQNGQWFVYEAIQPVKLTPIRKWIDRGKNGHFVVKRLRRSGLLTPQTLTRMRRIGEKYQGKDYDSYFEWSDRRIYCSELVWKIYKLGAGVEVGTLQKLRDFDLSSPTVRAKMKERYGNRVPMNEPVISPAAMFNSTELAEVVRN